MNAEQLLKGGGLGPPKDIPPSELVRKLMDNKRPSEVLPFPRTDAEGKALFEYRMMILTQEELDSCIANAEAYTRRVLTGKATGTEEVANVRREAWSEVYENAKCIELLFEAMREAEDMSKRVFTTPSAIRRLLTIDECALLFRSYEAVQFRWGPLWRLLSSEELEEWVTRLTEGADHYPLEHLGPGTLNQLVTSLAYLVRFSKIGTGSSGQPSEDGATSDTPSDSPEVGMDEPDVDDAPSTDEPSAE